MKRKIVVGVGLLMSLGVFMSTKIDDRLFEIAKNLEIFSTMYRELNATYFVNVGGV